MSNFEFNKIFAALLCALLTIWLAGFAAEHIMSPHEMEKNAVEIEGASDAHGGGEVSAAPEHAEPILALIAAADAEKGAKISKACAACHSFDKGGPVKQGPNMWNIVGRAKGAADGFDYSPGMKAKGGDWDYESLNQFLWKPKKFIDGTKMTFVGLKKGEDRAALIAWLRNQADSAHALPSAAEIAQEAADLAPPAEAEAEDGEAEAGEAETAPAADAPAETATEAAPEEAHH